MFKNEIQLGVQIRWDLFTGRATTECHLKWVIPFLTSSLLPVPLVLGSTEVRVLAIQDIEVDHLWITEMGHHLIWMGHHMAVTHRMGIKWATLKDRQEGSIKASFTIYMIFTIALLMFGKEFKKYKSIHYLELFQVNSALRKK